MLSIRQLLIFPFVLLVLLFSTSAPAFAVTSKPGSASELKVKGDVMMNESRYSEALEYYTAALDKAKADKDTHTYNACIGNISNIYAIMGDPQRSLHYQKQGYESSVATGDSAMMRVFAANIVAQYCMLEDVKNAKIFFKKQMQLASDDHISDRYYDLYNQGMIAQAEENYDQAVYYYRAALNFASEHEMDPRYVLGQYHNLGVISLQTKQFDQAIKQFEEAESMAKQAGRMDLLGPAYRGLAKAYKHLGDSVTAASYKAKAVAISDTLYDRKRFSTANDKLFEYENAENQKQIDRLVSRNHTMLLIVLAVLLVAGIITYLYLALRRKNRNLQEAQRLLVSKNEELVKADEHNQQLLQHYVEGEKQQEVHNDIGLTQETIDVILSRINQVMGQLDVISDKDFNLAQLAQKVGTNTRYVSWVINDVYGKNFKTFLNEYRIKEACRRLADGEHYGNMTIQAVYEELGYQTAASFINAFKRSMGMTPSTYQRLARERSDVLPHTDGADDGV